VVRDGSLSSHRTRSGVGMKMSYRTVQSTKQCLHSYWQQSLVMFTEDRAPEQVFDKCYERLEAADFLLRQWTALCFAQMWDDDDIKVYGVDRGTQDKLIAMLSDDSAEVQSPALYALGTFVGASGAVDPNKQSDGGSGTMFQLRSLQDGGGCRHWCYAYHQGRCESHVRKGVTRCHQLLSQRAAWILRGLHLNLLERRLEMESLSFTFA
jgi:hypothetical protein